jgi:hypothetical protein
MPLKSGSLSEIAKLVPPKLGDRFKLKGDENHHLKSSEQML